jgi:hypothetical protein
MDNLTDGTAAEKGQSDPAVEFLTALQPRDRDSRRRAFAALLRAVVSEGQAR